MVTVQLASKFLFNVCLHTKKHLRYGTSAAFMHTPAFIQRDISCFKVPIHAFCHLVATV